MGMMVANGVSPGNPSNADKFESMIQGKDDEITHIDRLSNYYHADVKDTNYDRGESSLKFKYIEAYHRFK